MFSRIIHYFILPCSEISLLIEKKTAGKISFFEKVRLFSHLRVCRLCEMYHKKVIFLDKSLQNTEIGEKKVAFDDSEIQLFKNKMKENIKK
ncbi:hypothetical protein [Capnocytophaga stomatis]|uniref:Zf-HC2 domain-containing protein n=1 Tax=Capnocytophaga stomatis TaxID=1848904 RepID=A0A250FTW1_9FLAO|nr:hypothetical protein [Capnocytophaga stomatis]ATA88599.1 hypothetical protein CGC58_01910 [Capnocytophaga stomatis]GIJ93323.1 hypothetical protein CAPN002_05410 [Capnocytophaga stomatis]GIJ96454.1 hypothetical protein CAPN001_10230 [Capnocytophaga stomatis]GIM50246.1 hypothetical protein CAPN003_16980 [Capnocytophaga stomatis]